MNTPTGNTNLRIGQRVPGGSILFDGTIDEVRVWNVARTATEIVNNMNAEFCTLPAGLVAYYNFNQGIAGVTNPNIPLLDAVNLKNGTLNNFANSGATSNWVTGATITPGLSHSYSSATACDSFMTSNGNYLTTSGLYTDTLVNSNFCDSLATVNLTINNSAYTSISDSSVCGAYNSPSGRYTYTSTGVYYDTLTTPQGCDWVFELDLVFIVNNTISESSGHTLTSSESNGDTYQWVDCANDYALIAGATAQSFTPAQDGEYAVIVTIDNCVDTTDCYTLMGVGVNSLIEEVGFSVYPNPASDQISITLNSVEDYTEIEIIDVTGAVVYSSSIRGSESHLVQTSSFTSGLYLINIYSGTFHHYEKLLIE